MHIKNENTVKILNILKKFQSKKENKTNYYSIFFDTEGHLLEDKKAVSWYQRLKMVKNLKRSLPNVTKVRLYSETFDRTYFLTVATAILRTIDKKGGLDNYLLNTPDYRLNSEWGSKQKLILLEEIKRRKLEEAVEMALKN